MFTKLVYLVPSKFKFRAFYLSILMILGMIIEAFGLGLIFPIVNLIVEPEILNQYVEVKDFFLDLGIDSNQELVVLLMIFFAFTYLIKTALLIIILYYQAVFSQDVSQAISSKLFENYLKQDYIVSLNTNSATLIRNTVTEVSQLTTVIQNGLLLMTEITISLSILLTLIFIDPIGATSVFSFLFLSSSLLYLSIKGYLYKTREKKLNSDEKRTINLVQGYNAFKEVKIFLKENFFINKFSFHNKLYHNFMKKLIVIQQVPRLYLELISVIGLSIFVVVSILRGVNVETLIAVLSVFALAAFRLIPSANRILTNLQAIRYALPSVNLLHKEFLNFRKTFSSNISSKTKTKTKTKTNYNYISINKLTYSYPKTDFCALKDISLEIPFGSTIGIIGKSGSGKSTFVDVLIGLLKPSSGIIEFENNNVHENIKHWIKQVGYVPQTVFLIDDSLKRNIAFGIEDDKIDLNKLNKVIEESQLTDLINSLPDGINNIVGERGVKLSGGQRQRIGIARALYNNPKILILDEGTSALDSNTEKYIMNSIDLFKGNKTIILIAHRYSTLVNCDIIYKMSNGKIVKKGNYKEMNLN